MIPAFKWDKLHPGFKAVGQRWYCKTCTGTKHNCKFGQVVELNALTYGKDGVTVVIYYSWTEITRPASKTPSS